MNTQSQGAVGWVRIIGWQIVGMTLVIFIGISTYRLCSSLAKESDTRAKSISELTQLIANLTPSNSKDKVGELINCWIVESQCKTQMLQDVS